MTVFLDENGLVPALEQMTVPLVAFIKELGIDAVQLPHADGEIAVGSFNEQMIMVGHEAVGDNVQDIVDRFYVHDIVDKRSLTIE